MSEEPAAEFDPDDEALVNDFLAGKATEPPSWNPPFFPQRKAIPPWWGDFYLNAKWRKRPWALRSELAFDAASWMAAAVGSGVLGNIAYDVLRKVLPRKSDRPHVSDAAEKVMARLAFEAVLEQCRRSGVRLPVRDDMRVDSWYYGLFQATAVVNCEGVDFSAEVAVPYQDREAKSVYVLLRGEAAQA